jgi:hypothetical protein
MTDTTTRAYCWASGQIEFGSTIPKGALLIARGPDALIRDMLSAHARHGHPTKDAIGRRVDGPLLVPGIPEADDDTAALLALHAFGDRLRAVAKDNADVMVMA